MDRELLLDHFNSCVFLDLVAKFQYRLADTAVKDATVVRRGNKFYNAKSALNQCENIDISHFLDESV